MSYKIANHIPKVVNKLNNLIIRSGKGCWVTDINNKKYLDMTSGIGALSTGHSHPKVIKAIQEQSEKIIHAQQNCFFSHQPQIDLTKKLLSIIPKDLDTFFYVNSGSEATDNSIKIARHFTKKPNIIAFNQGFHGRTLAAMSLTSSKLAYRSGCSPLLGGVYICDPNKESLDYLFNYISNYNETAAIIVEPILGEGGIKHINSNFLKYIRKLTLDNNILLIIDEVQTGAGRTGKWWASNNIIIPDIMTFAKGIASGFPFAGLVTRKNFMDNVAPNMLGGTYGGNALGSAASLATIKVIEEENLIFNSNRQGSKLKTELQKINGISEVRQYGLMIAIDLENKELVPKFLNNLTNNGIIVLLCGDNSIRLLPPLIINDEEINIFLEIFSKVLRQF